MHLLEHRHKAMRRQVKTNTHLFTLAVNYESVHIQLTSVCDPLVFLELHEFLVEASGFRETSTRAVQGPPHTLQ